LSDPTRNSLTPTDPELMQRVVDRDETAFEILLRRHEDAVFRLATRILAGNVDEGRDVTQELFISLWENPRAWKPKALFTTWLYRVTTNRALNRRRAIRLKSVFSLSNPEMDEPEADDDLPDVELEKDESRRRFEANFNRLPPKQRAALHLRYSEELPVAELAKALGMSVKAVESLLYRAKQALRNSMKNQE
jgi:RNA polymerase sigma-70 factor (ECF subfamily)